MEGSALHQRELDKDGSWDLPIPGHGTKHTAQRVPRHEIFRRSIAHVSILCMCKNATLTFTFTRLSWHISAKQKVLLGFVCKKNPTKAAATHVGTEDRADGMLVPCPSVIGHGVGETRDASEAFSHLPLVATSPNLCSPPPSNPHLHPSELPHRLL